MMHIVSEINGLYAGAAKVDGGTDYTDLSSDSLLTSIADLQTYKNGTTIAIKTPFPNIVFFAGTYKPDPNDPTKQIAGSPDTAFLILAGDIKQGKVDKTFCTKLMAINFGSQAIAYGVNNGTTGKFDFINANRPFSDRVKVCNNLKDDDHVGVAFK